MDADDRDVVVVSDTSVLMDLERGSLLEAAFRLPPFAFAVPDLLYERELKAKGGSGLRARPANCRVGRRWRGEGRGIPEASTGTVVAGLLRPGPRGAG